MNIAVTGATGFLGRYVVSSLAASGHRLICWHRPTSDLGHFPSPMPEGVGHLDRRGAGRPGGGGAARRDGRRRRPRCTRSSRRGIPRGSRGPARNSSRPTSWGASASSTPLMPRASNGSSSSPRVPCTTGSSRIGRWTRPIRSGRRAITVPTRRRSRPSFTATAIGEGMPICALRPTGIYGLAHPPHSSKWYPLVEAIVAGKPVECRRGGKEVHASDVARAVEMLLVADREADNG